jgi:hypothetical protein
VNICLYKCLYVAAFLAAFHGDTLPMSPKTLKTDTQQKRGLEPRIEGFCMRNNHEYTLQQQMPRKTREHKPLPSLTIPQKTCVARLWRGEQMEEAAETEDLCILIVIGEGSCATAPRGISAAGNT